MTMRTDVGALDQPYRAKRLAQAPWEYAAAIEVYRAPARLWPAALIFAVLLLAAVALKVMP